MTLKNSSIEKLNNITADINTLDNEINDLISKTKFLLESSKDDGLIFNLDIKIPKKEEKYIFDEDGSLKSKSYIEAFAFPYEIVYEKTKKASYLSHFSDTFMKLTNKIDKKDDPKSYELSNSDCVRIINIVIENKKKKREVLSQLLNRLLKSLTK